MSVTFQSEGIDFPKIEEEKLSEWINAVAQKYNKVVGEISYLFCDDEKILEVNKEYLDHDFYTDIITFDYSEDNIISGDIIISLQTVESNSQMYQTDYLEELHRVIIHGILHLCRLKDSTIEEEKLMRTAENTALVILFPENSSI